MLVASFPRHEVEILDTWHTLGMRGTGSTDIAHGERLDVPLTISLQLSACHAAEGCARAVDLVHEAAGTSAIVVDQHFERPFRDADVLTQHTTKSAARHVSAGRLLFGLRPDTPLRAR